MKKTNLKDQPQVEFGKQIYKTKDYDKFTLLIGNRAVKPSHVKALEKSIEAEDLLEDVPGIVNKYNQIGEGQHRFLAAKAKGKYFHFVINPNFGLKQAIRLNVSALTWRPADYMNTFISEGNKHYIILKDFADEYNFSISNAVAILSIGSDKYLKSPIRKFKDGSWEITNLKMAIKFAQMYTEIAMYTEEKTAKDRDLMRAVCRMYFVSGLNINHSEFMRQLKSYPYPIYRRLGMKEYMRQLEDIYNQGRKQTVRFS